MMTFKMASYTLAFLIGGILATQNQPGLEYADIITNEPSAENPENLPPAMDSLEMMGKKLFVNNCAACHNRNMKDALTGPALSGVEARWSEYPKNDLYRFIRNSQKMIAEGHPRALEVWETNKPRVMLNFHLTDKEIDAILTFVEYQSNR